MEDKFREVLKRAIYKGRDAMEDYPKNGPPMVVYLYARCLRASTDSYLTIKFKQPKMCEVDAKQAVWLYLGKEWDILSLCPTNPDEPISN